MEDAPEHSNPESWRVVDSESCGCRKLVRHAEQAFRGRDLILAMPSVRPELAGALPTRRSLEPRTPRNGSIPECVRRTLARRTERVSDRTIRVDRVVPEIHHATTAARAKPQVTGPDEFSARTASDQASFDPRSHRSGRTARVRTPSPWPRRSIRAVPCVGRVMTTCSSIGTGDSGSTIRGG
jgi:hypothetical protein